MGKQLLWLLLLLAGFCGSARAQDRIIMGKVTDQATSQGLPGVTVLVKGRPTIGTSTTSDGNYSLAVPASATALIFSFVGYTSQEQPLTGATTISVTMAADSKQLNEIVVTALGLEANRDQLGTAQATLKGPALVRSGETSVITALSGKTPGVNITRTSGDPGASANIQIRGAATLTGNLQPLIIVDGVPISNSSIGNDGILSSNGGASSNQTDGVVQASRLNDINPDDIASMEVLKGAAASMVWGTRGANGVIVITTKKGQSANGRVNLSYRSSVSIDQINRRVPLQRSFGQGSLGLYSSTAVRSWGDQISTRAGGQDNFIQSGTGYQGYITFPDGTRRYNIAAGTVANPHGGKNSQDTFDHSQDMFNNGYTWDNIATLSGGDQRSNFYLSLGNTHSKGIALRHSDNDRTTIRLNVDRQLTDKLRVSVNTTYARTLSNRVQQGSNLSGIFLGGLRSPTDFNNGYYQGDYTDATGNIFLGRQSSYRNPLGRTTQPGFDNPLWTIDNVLNQSRLNRLIGSVEFVYDITPWLNILNRTGVDTYTETRSEYFPIGAGANPTGSLRAENIIETQVNNDLIVRASTNLTSNIRLSGLVGYNLNARRTSQIGASSNQFINPFSPPQLDNTPAANRKPYNVLLENRTAGLYGQVDLSLFDQVFLNGTVRGEQASTFGPQASNTFVYPGGTAAWQFTKLALLADNKVLSFGKIRFAYGQVGVQPLPYQTITYYVPATLADGWGTGLDAANYGGGFVQSSAQGNPFLRPERKTEYEGGLDLRFFNNRIGFTGTIYTNRTRDVILSVPVANTTGFASTSSNAATISNKGLELSLDGDIIKTGDFTFNLAPNFSLNRNKVEELAGATSVFLTGFTGSESRAVKGYQMGELWGNRWARNEDGSYKVDANGFATLGDQGVIGDPNPQWRGGLNLNFRYKGLNLNVLLDHVHSFDVWNGTKGALYSYGTHRDTEQMTTVTATQAAALKVFQINAGGSAYQQATTVATRYRPNADGSYTFRGRVGNFGAGDVALDEGWYQAGLGNGFNGPAEQFVERVNITRLREVSLNYSFTQPWVHSITRMSSIDLAVTGRNLYLWTNYSGIDPETNLTGVTNGRGLDYFNNPSTRSILFSLKLTY